MPFISPEHQSHVRIWRSDRKTPVGCGFVIDERHVMTCAHVVAMSMGRQTEMRGSDQVPPGAVQLDLPSAPGEFFEASVRFWLPERDPDDARFGVELDDVAVLELTGPCPRQWRTVKVLGVEDADGEAEVFGVVSNRLNDQHAVGRIRGHSNPHRLRFSEGTKPIVEGFSGAAVWSTARKAVVGMMAQAARDGSGLLVPVASLAHAWPGLARSGAGTRGAAHGASGGLNFRDRLAEHLCHFDRVPQTTQFETWLREDWDDVRRPMLCVLSGTQEDVPRLCRDKCRRVSLNRRLQSMRLPSDKVDLHKLSWPDARRGDVTSHFKALVNMFSDELGVRGDTKQLREAFDRHGRPLIFVSELRQSHWSDAQRELLGKWGAFWRDLASDAVSLPLIHFVIVRLEQGSPFTPLKEVDDAFQEFHVQVLESLGPAARGLPVLEPIDVDELADWVESISDEIDLTPDDVRRVLAGVAPLKDLQPARMAHLVQLVERLGA